MTASLMIAIGLWYFLTFELKNCINYCADAYARKAEASARGKQADMERAKFELERARLEQAPTAD